MQLYASLHVAPGALVDWLHSVVSLYNDVLQSPSILIAGPHTFRGDAPSPFETLAIYRVDERLAYDIAARQVVLALTYLPLSHPAIGLDLQVWPSFPAALDTLKLHFFEYFTQASPVLSSAAALHFVDHLPILACNLWLQEQLAINASPDQKALKDLYAAWAEQYRALRGVYPGDPRRSFRTQLTKSRH